MEQVTPRTTDPRTLASHPPQPRNKTSSTVGKVFYLLAAVFATGALLSILRITRPSPHPLLWTIGSVAFAALGFALRKEQKVSPLPKASSINVSGGVLDGIAIGQACSDGPSPLSYEYTYADPFCRGHAFALIHGSYTEATAVWIEGELTEILNEAFSSQREPARALEQTFRLLDERFRRQFPGAEATLLLVVKIRTTLWAANISTFEALFIPQEKEHDLQHVKQVRLSDEKYQEEIRRAGGTVTLDQGLLLADGSPQARSIGALSDKKHTLCTPEINDVSIEGQKGILLLYSPALTTYFSPQRIAEDVRAQYDSPPEKIAENLLKKAQQAGWSLNINIIAAKI